MKSDMKPAAPTVELILFRYRIDVFAWKLLFSHQSARIILYSYIRYTLKRLEENIRYLQNSLLFIEIKLTLP